MRLLWITLAALVPTVFKLRELGWIPTDWSYFHLGSTVLRGGDPATSALSLYAEHPEIQIGPPALAVVTPFTLLPLPVGGTLCALLLVALLPWCCHLLEGVAARRGGVDDGLRATVLAGGLLAAVHWSFLAGAYAHVDDALVIFTGCAAASAIDRRRPLAAALLIGVAAAAKPWAIGLVPLVAAAPVARRWSWPIVATAVAGSFWLPFVLGDHRTLGALRSFRVPVQGTSPLALLGVATDAAIPAWVRPTQFLVAVLVAAIAVAFNQAWLAPLLAISSRLALDPQNWDYYFASVAVAALTADVLRRRVRGPWLTMFTVFVLYDARWLSNDAGWIGAWQTAPFAVALLTLVLVRRGPGWSTFTAPNPTATRPAV